MENNTSRTESAQASSNTGKRQVRRGWASLPRSWFSAELAEIAREYDAVLDIAELRTLLRHREQDLRYHQHYLALFCTYRGVQCDDIGQPKRWRDDYVWRSAENVERARLEIALIRLRIARIKTMEAVYGSAPRKKTPPPASTDLEAALKGLLSRKVAA